MKYRYSLGIVAAFFLYGCFSSQTTQGISMQWFDIVQKSLKDKSEIEAFIPKSIDAIQEQEKTILKHVEKTLQTFVNQDQTTMTKESVLYAFDQLQGEFYAIVNNLQLLEMVHPDATMRNGAHEAFLHLQNSAIDLFNTKEIYTIFKTFAENKELQKTLDDEEKYGVAEYIKGFELSGLGLDDERFKEFKALQKEQTRLEATFDMNINTDTSSMICTKEDLAGINPSFFDIFEKEKSGGYIIRPDYPSTTEILSFCTVEKTRQRMWELFNNRAYPKNTAVLEALCSVRQKLAKLLGFKDFSSLNLSTKMAKEPSKVRSFLKNISTAARKKAATELDAWKKNGTKYGIAATETIEPWNIAFLKKAYERDVFAFDEREIRPYFSMENTIEGIFKTYQDFLNLRFEVSKPDNLWHEDVQLITVYDKGSSEPRGYILLDLFPRPAKYSHACHGGTLPTTWNADGSRKKSLGLVIANFPKPTKNEPSLLKHSDAVTFFHEFGHAMHFVLGTTKLARFAGTSTLWDFVEMPSQMFEEWMWKPEMIANMSKHYQTGQPLSQELIDKMIQKKVYDAGYIFCRQLTFADFSLTLYELENPNFDQLLQKMQNRYLPEIAWHDENHVFTSFGHLTGYAASYYGYMWSLVFACDIFNELSKEDLSPQAGARFVEMILGKGGSVHPEALLKNYLGRKPSSEAFFKKYNLK